MHECAFVCIAYEQPTRETHFKCNYNVNGFQHHIIFDGSDSIARSLDETMRWTIVARCDRYDPIARLDRDTKLPGPRIRNAARWWLGSICAEASTNTNNWMHHRKQGKMGEKVSSVLRACVRFWRCAMRTRLHRQMSVFCVCVKCNCHGTERKCTAPNTAATMVVVAVFTHSPMRCVSASVTFEKQLKPPQDHPYIKINALHTIEHALGHSSAVSSSSIRGLALTPTDMSDHHCAHSQRHNHTMVYY